MSNLLSKGAAFLNAQRETHMSEIVEYSRDSFTPITLSATIGRTDTESIDNEGMLMKSRSRDFIISADLIVLDGVKREPERGDEITEIDADGNRYVHTVLADNDGVAFEWSDEYRHAYRIHTKLDRTEST